MTEEEKALQQAVEGWSQLDAEIKEAEKRRFSLFQVIRELTAQLGIEERIIATASGDVRLTHKERSTWHQEMLTPLRELIPELTGFDLEDFLTPLRIPERKWNMTAVKPLMKQGGELKKVIQSSETRDFQLKLRKE